MNEQIKHEPPKEGIKQISPELKKFIRGLFGFSRGAEQIQYFSMEYFSKDGDLDIYKDEVASIMSLDRDDRGPLLLDINLPSDHPTFDDHEIIASYSKFIGFMNKLFNHEQSVLEDDELFGTLAWWIASRDIRFKSNELFNLKDHNMNKNPMYEKLLSALAKWLEQHPEFKTAEQVVEELPKIIKIGHIY